MDRIWLQACLDFARHHGVSAPYVDALHAFAYPNPRGGPPPPPEPRFGGDFGELEARLCAERLDAPVARDALIDDLRAEVDVAQARIFARRIAAVERALCELDDSTGRVLRVGLRQRLEGVLSAPRPRALRVRALADYYYSFAGRWLHARRASVDASTMEDAIGRLRWTTPFEGGSLAILDGLLDRGPVHANILRLDPGASRPRVLDCRDVVQRGVAFGTHVRSLGALAAVSGGFFLYSEPDIEPPSHRFDPVGLLVSDGRVLSPPIFGRGALLFDARGAWSIQRCGPQGMRMVQRSIEAPLDDLVTRADGSLGPDVPSVSVAANQVIAVGSSLPVPLNGFVLGSSAPWVVGEGVEYTAPEMPGGVVHDGVAGGPLLLQGGTPCLDLRAEGFWGSAPPVTFSQDETGDRNTLPRLAAGIDRRGRLVLVAIDGRNFERALGMTLGEVTALLLALGCTVATNLDGGSSKRMVVGRRTLDIASTEVEQGTPGGATVRPVHTAIAFMPA